MVEAFTCELGEQPRLDQFLCRCLPEWSRARLQRLIRDGAAQVDGAPVTRPGARLSRGARVVVALDGMPPPGAEATPQPEPIPFGLLYEDADLAVIDKPAGLMVHAGAGQRSGTLVNALLHHFDGVLSTVGGAARPGIVHRLDRCTSGVMVVARHDEAHRRLAEQFQRRSVQKLYVALAQGALPQPEGQIELPIHRDLQRRARMTTRRRNGRAAHTEYRLLEFFPPPASTPPALRSACSYSWIELQLHTGRTHQIRVHMAALGHPVVGDRLYGAAAALAGPGTLTGVKPPRVLLHSATLAFDHPRTGARMAFTAPLPADIAEVLAQLRRAASDAS